MPKVLQWYGLAGSPPQQDQPWGRVAPYPTGAKLILVASSKDYLGLVAAKDGGVLPSYLGLFEVRLNETEIERRSFRVLDLPTPGKTLQLPDGAVLVQQFIKTYGGDIFGGGTTIRLVYEVPADFEGLNPADLKAEQEAETAASFETYARHLAAKKREGMATEERNENAPETGITSSD